MKNANGFGEFKPTEEQKLWREIVHLEGYLDELSQVENRLNNLESKHLEQIEGVTLLEQAKQEFLKVAREQKAALVRKRTFLRSKANSIEGLKQKKPQTVNLDFTLNFSGGRGRVSKRFGPLEDAEATNEFLCIIKKRSHTNVHVCFNTRAGFDPTNNEVEEIIDDSLAELLEIVKNKQGDSEESLGATIWNKEETLGVLKSKLINRLSEIEHI